MFKQQFVIDEEVWRTDVDIIRCGVDLLSSFGIGENLWGIVLIKDIRKDGARHRSSALWQEEADIAIAYGGVHDPVEKAIASSDYVVYRGDSLCNLLKML